MRIETDWMGLMGQSMSTVKHWYEEGYRFVKGLEDDGMKVGIKERHEMVLELVKLCQKDFNTSALCLALQNLGDSLER